MSCCPVCGDRITEHGHEMSARWLAQKQAEINELKNAPIVKDKYKIMLSRLMAECKGLLAFEEILRIDAGNTNVNIFKLRIEQAEILLNEVKDD